MNKFKSKKGFTLAELLIVVAIIAVLVAIAVPLFVTGLQKAQKATEDANIRAVRGAAVVKILGTNKPTETATAGADTKGGIYTGVQVGSTTTYTWELQGPWYASATISESGDVSELVVNLNKTTAWTGYTGEDEAAVAQSSGGYKVYVKVTQLTIT